MAEQSKSDIAHLRDRVARTAGNPDPGTVVDHWGTRVPAHVPVFEAAYAADYARLAAQGGTGGAAFALLHRLRHESFDGFDIWRFVEALADRLTRKDG